MVNFNDFVDAYDGYSGSAEEIIEYLQDAVACDLAGKELVDPFFLYSTRIKVLMVAQAYVHQLGFTLSLEEYEEPEENWDDPSVPEWGWSIRVKRH